MVNILEAWLKILRTYLPSSNPGHASEASGLFFGLTVMLNVTIDNRGGRRDLKHVYRYMADACRGHVKSSRIAQFGYTTKAAFVALEEDFVHCSRGAQGPEAKRRKNQQLF